MASGAGHVAHRKTKKEMNIIYFPGELSVDYGNIKNRL
jgi:hypothetical protein